MSESATEERKAHDPKNCLCCEAHEALNRLFRNAGSEEVREHFRQSRIEFLKGVRSMLDARIDHLGKAGNKGTRVVVE
jgi:hypothetical protein